MKINQLYGFTFYINYSGSWVQLVSINVVVRRRARLVTGMGDHVQGQCGFIGNLTRYATNHPVYSTRPYIRW